MTLPQEEWVCPHLYVEYCTPLKKTEREGEGNMKQISPNRNVFSLGVLSFPYSLKRKQSIQFFASSLLHWAWRASPRPEGTNEGARFQASPALHRALSLSSEHIHFQHFKNSGLREVRSLFCPVQPHVCSSPYIKTFRLTTEGRHIHQLFLSRAALLVPWNPQVNSWKNPNDKFSDVK